MHHLGLLLILLLLAILLAPLMGQGLTALAGLLGPLVVAAPGAAYLSKLAAPALVAIVLMFGVLVVGVLKLVCGV